ncbi:VOC family protein [Janthinobacterium sp. B9-8]|uniref:VOC family protein n=1 Tax=Janthinobacterium sp. B9-8 TaxID=1236179 RepID=UPI00061D039B|nr:VOC family protein [Janthinobacterium sp. B9-8]AMC35677.1 lactoylglutathione lyase [Janthinobacterium sp. B9-8]
MEQAYLEHANITVSDLDRAVRFIQIAIPSWKIRGRGKMDWFGAEIDWLHIGDDFAYIALQSGGIGEAPGWKTHLVGVKHLGFVVPSLKETMQNLENAGFMLDHEGGSGPHRDSAYFMLGEDVQFEFVEYTSQLPVQRNSYSSLGADAMKVS